jgi:hypothetical protein
MTKNGEKADDGIDELESLESEAKEFTKACLDAQPLAFKAL